MPNIEAKPARLPWARLRAVTYNTPGPGETVSRKVARAKRRTVVAAGIALMMMLDRDFLGRWAIDPPGSRFRDQKDERPTALVFLLRACAYQRYQRPPDDPRKTNPSAHRIRPISSTIHKICSDEERRPPPPKSRRRRTRTIRAATICIPPWLLIGELLARRLSKKQVRPDDYFRFLPPTSDSEKGPAQVVRIGSRFTMCTIATRTIAPIRATMNEMTRL